MDFSEEFDIAFGEKYKNISTKSHNIKPTAKTVVGFCMTTSQVQIIVLARNDLYLATVGHRKA